MQVNPRLITCPVCLFLISNWSNYKYWLPLGKLTSKSYVLGKSQIKSWFTSTYQNRTQQGIHSSKTHFQFHEQNARLRWASNYFCQLTWIGGKTHPNWKHPQIGITILENSSQQNLNLYQWITFTRLNKIIYLI